MSDTPGRPPTEPPVLPKPVNASSMVIVYTGEGKGKTSAAMGTVLRSVARGWKVCVIQFIKSGRWRVGEEKVARDLGVEWWSTGDGFTWESEDLDGSKVLAEEAWEAAAKNIASGNYNLVVLDEITYAMTWGWIDSADVLRAIRDRPDHVNVIATGRDAPSDLVDTADTVTEMTKVRHAYDRGIRARRGIDY